ncbi:peptidylprolyl isomerase [soil metagenome]
MAEAKKGDTVKVHYTGKLEDGSIFDSSVERDPLEFTLGKGNMIAGFEKAVLGMEKGDSKSAKIPYQEAYGERREDMMVEIPKNQIPNDLKPEVGQQLSIKQQEGTDVPVVVTKVSRDNIVLDANHPLAGKDLIFDIELVEIN